MNLIYEAKHKSCHEMRTRIGCLSAWSNQGLIAYTVEKIIDGSQVMELRIFNSELPWDDHSFAMKVGRTVTSIKWSQSGERLLVGDSLGRLTIYTMNDYSSSDWLSEVIHEGNGNGIICCGWLHNGIKYEIQIDKVIPAPGSDQANLTEKITRQNFTPSLVEMGGCSIDGAFAITCHGQFILHVFNNFEPERKTQVIKQLVLPLWNFSHCDYAYQPNGRILIALSEGLINKPIRMVEIQINKKNPFQRNGNEIHIEVEEKSSLLHSSGYFSTETDCYLTHLLFPHNEYAGPIITVYSTEKQSILCWWMIRPDSTHLPSILGGPFQVQSWKCINHCPIDRITSITSHSLPVHTDKFCNSNFSCGNLLAISCLNGSFYLVHKLKLDILQRVDYSEISKSVDLPCNNTGDDFQTCVSAAFSPTGCALFTLDNMARISVIQVKPWRDSETPLSQKEASIEILLNYSMLNDVESWDTRNLLHDLVHRDSAIILRLDKQLQHSVQTNPCLQPFLAACQAQRILLLGRLDMFQSEYSRALSSILSTSFLNLFTSLLRPLRTNTDELSAAAKLREIAVSRADPDLEITLTQILSAFETDNKFLQKIPPLVQWVTQLILWQAANVKSVPLEVDELCRARQLLIIVRLWSHLMSSCSPQFITKDSSMDVLSELFRLLTSLWVSLKKDEEPNSDILDACAKLKGRVYVQPPDIDLPVKPDLNGSHIEIGRYPKIFSSNPASSRDLIDFVRRTKMGVNEIRHLRRCSRSGVCTQRRNEAPLPVWDNRFLHRSFCFGLWTRAVPRPRKRPATDLVQEVLEFVPKESH